MQHGYDPINKSYTVEQHRLANYFETNQSFHPFSLWPAWLQDVALTRVKSFQQRTDMFLHLWRNGVYAPTARTWTLAGDVQEGKIIWAPEYSVDVRMDMARLVKKGLDGQLVNDNASTYHHQTGQVVKGLNPAHWPTYEQLVKLRAAPARDEATSPGPERTRRQPRSTVYYPPQIIRSKGRLASGFRFVAGYGLMYWDGERWRQTLKTK